MKDYACHWRPMLASQCFSRKKLPYFYRVVNAEAERKEKTCIYEDCSELNTREPTK